MPVAPGLTTAYMTQPIMPQHANTLSITFGGQVGDPHPYLFMHPSITFVGQVGSLHSYPFIHPSIHHAWRTSGKPTPVSIHPYIHPCIHPVGTRTSHGLAHDEGFTLAHTHMLSHVRPNAHLRTPHIPAHSPHTHIHTHTHTHTRTHDHFRMPRVPRIRTRQKTEPISCSRLVDAPQTALHRPLQGLAHLLSQTRRRRLSGAHNNTAHNNTAHNNTAHNNTAHNNTAHNNTAHNNTAHNNTVHNNTAHSHELAPPLHLTRATASLHTF
eukprot:358344-Chlamydomonas_euryale.AAC.12